MATNDPLRISSTRTSFSSSQTIIEPEQQLQLQLQLSSSQENIPADQENHPQAERREERRTAAEDEHSEDEEHERRLRLIEVNRTRTRLIDEEQEPPPLALDPTGSSSPPTRGLISDIQQLQQQHSKEPLDTIIPLEILLSPVNRRKAFHFDHLLTIAELINHLLHHWPSDWCQAGSTVPHHTHQFRMVYMGRFLDHQETLNSLGKIRPIIIHLVIKPDAGTIEEADVDDDKAGLCGCWGTLQGRSTRRADRQGISACVIV